jgi:hypothetical protein
MAVGYGLNLSPSHVKRINPSSGNHPNEPVQARLWPRTQRFRQEPRPAGADTDPDRGRGWLLRMLWKMMGLLERAGKLLARFWMGLLGIAILLSFHICGFLASLAVGAGAAMLVGYGTPGAVLFFVAAFFFGLFLSVFVWPHVNGAIKECAQILMEKQPK